MIVKGITIHNTNNNLSAKENAELMNELINVSVHFFVDDIEIVKVVDESEITYHTGKGFDEGNMNTISIEICKSTCTWEVYKKAQDNAVQLIKSLQNKYGLTNDQIYFHNDFDVNKYCPHRILDEYKNKNEFIEKEMVDNDN